MNDEHSNNEAALVSASRQGDMDAVRKLLMDNWSWLRGIVYSIVGNISDVDDTLQNICLRVISNIDRLREVHSFRPWLAVLARREALSTRKKQKRKIPSPVQCQAEEQYNEKQTGVLESMVQEEQYSQILKEIKSLPAKYREVIILKYTEDMTYSKIGEILDIPITTVQIRLVRARRMIYEKITAKTKSKAVGT